MTELAHLAQQWLAFSLVLTGQVVLVLALREPVRAYLGAVACYRLWLLPVVWLPLYFLGPMLLATLATPDPTDGAQRTAAPYQQALQQFVEIELLPFQFSDVGSTSLAASGDTKIQGWSVLAVLWAAGTVALIFWHCRRWLDFSREVQDLSTPLTAVERVQVGTTAHFTPQVPVLRMHGLNGAALFGIFKPALLLPESFTERYDSTQRQIILAHESVHLRRGDNGWNLLALVLIALLWTNPLLFIAWRYFRFDQELSCDAHALARCTKAQQKRYARTLLHSLGSLSAYSNPPALSAWDNLHFIKERSLMVRKHLQAATRPITAMFTLLALAALGASLTITFAELVTPVAEAAEPTPVARTAAREPRPVTTQAVEQAQREVQAAQREVQVAQQRAQDSRQEIQAAQREVQQALQQVQAAQREAQEVTQEAQVAQQQVQTGQQEVQVAQQEVQVAQREVQAAQREVQAAQREVQQAQQQVQEVQQALQQEVRPVQEEEAQEAEQPVQENQQGVQVAQPALQLAQADQSIGMQTGRALTQAVEFLNSKRFAEARASLAGLRVERMTPFERSRYEQLMFNLAMQDEDYPEARAHLQAALDSGGLNPQETAQIHYQLAQLYMQEERNVEAEAPPPPVPQARITPDYPQRALALGLEGWVKVRFTVSETGSVIDPVVVDSRPRRIFDHAAIEAVSSWRYDPAMDDGAAAQYAGVETTFRFTLADM